MKALYFTIIFISFFSCTDFSPDEKFKTAKSLFFQEKYLESNGVLEKLLQNGNKHINIYFLKSLCHYRLNHYSNAMKNIEIAIKTKAHYAYYRLKGNIHMLKNEYQEAFQAYNKSLLIKKDTNIQKHMINIFLTKNKNQLLENILEVPHLAYLELNNKSPEVNSILAIKQVKLGKHYPHNTLAKYYLKQAEMLAFKSLKKNRENILQQSYLNSAIVYNFYHKNNISAKRYYLRYLGVGYNNDRRLKEIVKNRIKSLHSK